MVDLERFKQHCYADDIGCADDALMQGYLDAAVSWVETATCRSYDELCDIGPGDWPVMLQQAVLMLGAHFYATREAVGSVSTTVPYGVSALVKPYVKLT